ncbi:hypothetical protein ACHWQZ_G011235 [Mnemiopsis leidyi]
MFIESFSKIKTRIYLCLSTPLQLDVHNSPFQADVMALLQNQKLPKNLLQFFILTFVGVFCYQEHLHHFVHEFEELSKSKIHMEKIINSTIVTGTKLYVRIELQSKVFHATLEPHFSLFHPELLVKHKFAEREKIASLDISEYLEGHLIDMYASSKVLIHIKDDIVTGTIEIFDGEKYYIEPSYRHIKVAHNFHMIVYKQSDVKFNLTKPGMAPKGQFCGHELLENYWKFSNNDSEFTLPRKSAHDESSYSRMKRSSEFNRHCSLALVADYKFYQLNEFNEATTINYMVSIMQQVDSLFRGQSFDPGESDDYKGFTFTIKYIEVIMDDSENDPESYKYVHKKRDVIELLKSFSLGEWRPEYCLAHLFTNYDFDKGVLGLAYLANPDKSSAGGVCTRTYIAGDPKRRYSTNVGLTTITNFRRVLLSSEIVFVAAHEFGHNWGSPHDPEDEKLCNVKSNRYLMYPSAVDGSRPNNYKFSPCSIRAIHEVLKQKSDVCFTRILPSICGNGIVEEGESCDSGLEDSPCCNSCQLADNAQCEPANDECCGQIESDYHCKFHIGKACYLSQLDSCHLDRSCKQSNENDKVQCILGENAEDGVPCYDGGRCKSGVCLDQCSFAGKYPCICPENEFTCKRCCKENQEGQCQPFISDQNNTEITSYINRSDGSFCEDGACLDGICVVGAQDVQERLWQLYDHLNVDKVARWLKDNIVFTIILLSTIIWIPLSCFVNFLDKEYSLTLILKTDSQSGLDDSCEYELTATNADAEDSANNRHEIGQSVCNVVAIQENLIGVETNASHKISMDEDLCLGVSESAETTGTSVLSLQRRKNTASGDLTIQISDIEIDPSDKNRGDDKNEHTKNETVNLKVDHAVFSNDKDVATELKIDERS